MGIPDPDIERSKLARAGREWFAQLMLASLLIGDRPARMNTPYAICPQGRVLLDLLDPNHRAGGSQPTVYWEFKLDALRPGQQNRWPDLALRWPDRVLLVELKTETGSVRERQVDEYLQLGLHHYPDAFVDLLYITRDRVPSSPSGLPERAQYATTTWAQVADAIRSSWIDADADGRLHASRFATWLKADLLAGKPWRTETPVVTSMPVTATGQVDEMAQAMDLATQVQTDQRQRAVPGVFATKNEADDFRDVLQKELVRRAASGDVRVDHVRAWVWTRSSLGTALTDGGKASGVEVRLSYYRSPHA
ncbi:hypothetical protein [Sphaerisporangium dianthi]|uniref:TnsA endonuclease N-terminal domain-containing protein n=1 Tax=Sphaerisporangium dianthi TaxID=1436120 RepID=A0ABV9C8C6_9ACTN